MWLHIIVSLKGFAQEELKCTVSEILSKQFVVHVCSKSLTPTPHLPLPLHAQLSLSPHTTHRCPPTVASPSTTVSDAPHTGWEQRSSPLSPDLPERSLKPRGHQSGNYIYPETNISNPLLIGKLDNKLLVIICLPHSQAVFLLPLEMGLVQCLLMIDGLHCCEGV